MTTCEHAFVNADSWPGQWSRCLRCEEMARRPFVNESDTDAVAHHADCIRGEPCRFGGSAPPQPCKPAHLHLAYKGQGPVIYAGTYDTIEEAQRKAKEEREYEQGGEYPYRVSVWKCLDACPIGVTA